jgi:hypothetical protein
MIGGESAAGERLAIVLDPVLRADVRAGLVYGAAAVAFLAAGVAVAPTHRVAAAVGLLTLGAGLAHPVLHGWYFPASHPLAYQPSSVPLLLTWGTGVLTAAVIVVRLRQRHRPAAL